MAKPGNQLNQDSLPISLYTAAAVRQLDQLAIESRGIPGLTLMRRAASACVDALCRHWPGARDVRVYCGSGNNAGDGFLMAGMLAEKGYRVTVAVVGQPSSLGADATEAHRYCLSTTAKVNTWTPLGQVEADVVVDALLGTGLSGEVRAHYADAIKEINTSGKPVLAVDIPSGLSSDTGVRLGASVSASVTVTFIGLKCGMFTLDGPDACGRIEFSDLQVPSDIYEGVDAAAHRIDLDELRRQLPVRPRNAHKNQFGHVLVVGGDAGMGGAVAMSAEAALRSGAGLVSVATHPVNTAAILARRPELMVRGVENPNALAPLLERASVLVLGPGLGQDDWGRQMFAAVMAASHERHPPMVVDADGLTLLGEQPEARDNWVLTPHPGEASRLMPDVDIQSDRFDAVTRLQAAYGGAALLKGAGTVIADGHANYLCDLGNPGMSTAGMGDVLSGVVGGLLAQGLTVSRATRLAVAVHAAAGDACSARGGERGLVATDLMADIRRLLNP